MSHIYVKIQGKSEKLEFDNGIVLTGQDGFTFKLGKAIKQGGNGVVFEATCFTAEGKNVGFAQSNSSKHLAKCGKTDFKTRFGFSMSLITRKSLSVLAPTRHDLGTSKSTSRGWP